MTRHSICGASPAALCGDEHGRRSRVAPSLGRGIETGVRGEGRGSYANLPPQTITYCLLTLGQRSSSVVGRWADEIPTEDRIVLTGGILMSTHDAEYFRLRRRAQGIPARDPFCAPKFLQRATELQRLQQLPWPRN